MIPTYEDLIEAVKVKRDDMVNFPTVRPWLEAALVAISQAREAECLYVRERIQRVREDVLVS